MSCKRLVPAALVVLGAWASISSAPANAATIWLSNGTPVAPHDGLQTAPVIASDGAGGAFVAWQDYRLSSPPVTYAQHLLPGGGFASRWKAEGLPVWSWVAGDPVMVADGQGGAWVAASDGWGVAMSHMPTDPALMTSVVPSAGIERSRGGPVSGDRAHASPTDAQKESPTVLPFLVPDGAGGVFMAWEQGGHLQEWPAVQHYTAAGAVAAGWPASYARLGAWEGLAPVMCSDGANGVIVAWIGYDGTGEGVLANRLDATGTIAPGWPGPGLALCAAPGNQDALGIVPDGSGGAIIVWQDPRNGSYEQVYAQRVTASGGIAPGWAPDGIPICTSPTDAGITRDPLARGPQRYSSVAPDGSGGAFIVWADKRTDAGDIYAQHLLPDGSLAPGWPANGFGLCVAPGSQMAPSITPDGIGGAFVSWQDRRAGDGYDIYTQHVGGDGALPAGWPANGLLVCTAPGDQFLPQPVSDGAGGAFVAWQDQRCTTQIFASRIAPDGTLPTLTGVATTTATLVGSTAESGAVRLEWQIQNGPADVVSIDCRQVDGPWTRIGTAVPDGAGSVTYTDASAVAGCRYDYALGVPGCGTERIVGETWVQIPVDGFPPLAVSNQTVVADSGRVRLSWHLPGRSGLGATLFRRDSCSAWSPIDTTVTDESGQATFEDHQPFEGQAECYRLLVHACLDQIVADVWMTIPVGHGFTPTLATLTHEAVDTTSIQLVWQVVSGPPSTARVYREDSTGGWFLSSALDPDPGGMVRFVDASLHPDTRYQFQLSLLSCGVEKTFEPIVVTTPTSVDPPPPVDPLPSPAHRFELRLRGAKPNPAYGQLSVSFSLAGNDPAMLEVFDTGGRMMLSREVGGLGSGDHALVLGDVSSLRPGLYVIRLSQSGRSQVSRAVLMR